MKMNMEKESEELQFNAGVDSTVIKSQSGHSDILTSMKYYNKDNHSLAERKKQIERAVVAL